jgi:hypothetical protein
MTEYSPFPGMPGGAPYDQEMDWGFEDWTDSGEQLLSFSPEDNPVANQARKSYAGRIALAVGMSAILAGGLIVLPDDDKHRHAIEVPSVLPPAVRAAYNGVLAMNYQNMEGVTRLKGSGVKIGNDLVLTAGHVVINDGASITSPTCNVGFTGVYDDQGSNTPVQDWVGKNESKGEDNENSPDYALLRISTATKFSSLPSIPIAPKPLHAGEEAFFINYEEIAPDDKFNRYPNSSEVPYSAFNNGNFSTTAAEFVGVVVSIYGGQYAVATGMRSYGPKPYSQSNLRPGGSGGAVLNAQGQLEGLSVATSNSLFNPGDVLKKYKVRLPMKPSQEFTMAYVQPITPSLVKSSEAQLAAAPSSPSC